jgi:hypothetical protein
MIIFAALMLLNCAPQVMLIPSPQTAKNQALPDAAADSVSGIKVLIETQAWTGLPEILDQVTPIRVTIHNLSGNPLRLRTSEFKLIGSTGSAYAALPPYQIKGTITEPYSPGFAYHGFAVAPYWSYLYPDFPIYSDPFDYDHPYYDSYYPYWQRIPLPTAGMVRMALPDGVVKDSGDVSGFLYFQKVPSQEQHAIFRGEMVNAMNGSSMGAVAIPLLVVKR